MPVPPLPVKTLLAYGAPALPLAALSLPAYIYLPTFYAEHMALGLTAVGLALMLARLWDVVSDPLIGWLSDTLPTPFGRRRPWIVAGTPIVAAAIWALFAPPQGAGTGHLIGWSLALHLGWTMVILPLSAWGAELSGDYDERTRIAGYREGFVVLGTLLALGLPAFFGLGGAADAGGALRLLAWVTTLLLPLSVLLLILKVPEPPSAPRVGIRWRDGMRVIAGNAPFRRLIAAYLMNGIANGLPATLFLLFVGQVLALPEKAGPLLFVYFLCGVLAVPLWIRLSARFGKHRVWCGAMIFNCVVFAIVPLLGEGDFWPFLAVCMLTGLCLGADLTLPSSMQADVVDVDTAETGQVRTGLYFALWGMVTKLALALSVGVAFPLLELFGFDRAGGNDPAELFALTALYCLTPVIFKAVAIILMRGYPITAEMQAATRARIDGRRGEEDMAGRAP